MTGFEKVLSTVLLGLALTLVVPSQAIAQEGEGCAHCEEEGSGTSKTGWSHWFVSPEDGGVCVECSGGDSMGCHPQNMPARCTGQIGEHELCDEGCEGSGSGSSFMAILAHLDNAISESDSGRISSLIGTHPATIRYDGPRQVIAVMTCGGRVLARLPVSDSFGSALVQDP